MKRWILAFSLAGFLGAAIYYSPYIGLHMQTGLVCPLCPHLLTAEGPSAGLWVRATISQGILNALLFSLVGVFLYELWRKLKILFSRDTTN